MSHENRSEPIVYVTAARSSPLEERLREATTVPVRSVPPTAVTDRAETEVTLGVRNAVDEGDAGNAVDESNDGDENGDRSRPPTAVVVELEETDRVRAVLESVTAVAPSVPTVVAPPAGSEALAAVAVRADADEYVPGGSDEDRIERLLTAIGPDPDTESGPDRTPRPATATDGRDRSSDTYHRVLANELPDEGFVIAADGTYLEAKVRPESADLYSAPADQLRGKGLVDVFPDDQAEKLQACIDRTLRTEAVQSIEYETETTDGSRRFEARVVPIDERIEGHRAVVWLARDITERVNREQELQSRQDQLETLNRISVVVGEVIETLVEAPSPDAIERGVCEQLVESELYCGAWIAEWTGEGTLAHRTSAGEATTYLETVTDCGVDHEWLVQQVVETGDPQTVSDAANSESLPEPLRAAARTDGVNSILAVPISHNDSLYGVLTVLSSREEAFSEGERAGFALLGETIGFTIMAVKNRQLLFADTVVELEFEIDGGDTFSFDLSEQYGCTCALEWAGTTASGRTVQYVTIEGLDGQTVLEEAEAHHSIEACRLIHDGESGCTIEMRLSESGVRTLANHGATIRDVTVADGVGTCLIEVSQDADVREIAEALTVVYENTELVARREVDRQVRTATERRDRILDQLTDRQLTTLRLAYYSGFFDWPRESTGEEIAEAMGVSAPTMHQHLRKGLKAVLAGFFEASGGTEAD